MNWAIANGETVTGVTTMKMDAGLDTGDILLQRETEIGAEETAPELMSRLSIVGAELLMETLERIGEIDPQQQDEGLASFAPIMKREDGLIDWSLNSKQINDRVRGFQPFPSSFTTYKGQRVTIWEAKAIGQIPSNDLPAGTVRSIENRSLSIACGGSSSLSVAELQPEGKRRMSAADFINGSRVQVGDRFGDN